MKILISDKSSPSCEKILREAGHTVDVKTDLSPQELKNIIGEYHGLIVRSATKVTADMIQAARNLKVIGRAGTGVDNIDLEAAHKQDIVVMNTPGGNSNAVAELVLAQMLNLSRDLFTAVTSLKEGAWEKKKFKGFEISGKMLGLLGYGRVSRLVGQKALALGMTVHCFDPKIHKTVLDADGISLVCEPEELLAGADYLSVHLSRREDTRNFLSTPQFQKMKRGVFLINASRGGIVDEKALLQALNEGIVAGAALDVYETEPPVDFELVRHPRVICTPHIGAATYESQEKVAVMIAEQFVDFFAGHKPQNVVKS